MVIDTALPRHDQKLRSVVFTLPEPERKDCRRADRSGLDPQNVWPQADHPATKLPLRVTETALRPYQDSRCICGCADRGLTGWIGNNRIRERGRVGKFDRPTKLWKPHSPALHSGLTRHPR